MRYFFINGSDIKTPYKLVDNQNALEVDNKNNKIIYRCNDNEYKKLLDISKGFLIVHKLYRENIDIDLYKNKLTLLEHNKDVLKKILNKYNKIKCWSYNACPSAMYKYKRP